MKEHVLKKWMIFVLIITFFVPTFQVKAGEGDSYYHDNYGEPMSSQTPYHLVAHITASSLNLEGGFVGAKGIFVKGSLIYLCDTGNNRIIEIERTGIDQFILKREIKSFEGDVENRTFNQPTDVAVMDNGDLYIADSKNNRILKLNSKLELQMVVLRPDNSAFAKFTEFIPDKIAVDAVGRVYCKATNVNQGIVKFENDGTFSKFVGALKVKFNPIDYMWRRIATKEQKAKLLAFVPTEYDNIYLDEDGLLYTCTSNEDITKMGELHPVQRLNLLGNDVLIRNSLPVVGDFEIKTTDGKTTYSKFIDITAMKYGMYTCLDKTENRIFTYDDQGYLLYAFGGTGYYNGKYEKASSIDHMGDSLLIVDEGTGSVNVLDPTEYGMAISNAIEAYSEGNYNKAEGYWREVLKMNENYDMAYIGIGQALLQKGEYKEAMKYFEAKQDVEDYSLAFREYRKEWIDQNALNIAILLLVVVVLPLLIGKIKRMRLSVLESDYLAYKYKEEFSSKWDQRSVHIFDGIRNNKKIRKAWDKIKFAFYCMTHPLDGFWDLARERKGSMALATAILICTILVRIIKLYATGFTIYQVRWSRINVFIYVGSVVLPLILWCAGNWLVTTLFDGKGTIKQIYMATCYGLLPYSVIQIPLILVSNVILRSEADFYYLLGNLSLIWTFGLIVLAMGQIHDYKPSANILSLIGSLFAVMVLIFLILVFLSLVSQVITFLELIIQEFWLRTKG